jgi:hypothetical protein
MQGTTDSDPKASMRSMCTLLRLLWLVAVTSGSAAPAKPPASAPVIAADLDGDGRRERIVLDVRRNPTLSIRRGARRLWQGVPSRWRPWKLAVADVDGDGKREVVVGVHKATRFFPRPHNCLFVYRFDGRTVQARWLGSSLSKPFTDFVFANLDGDRAEELVAVESTKDGRRCAVVYSWNGFGFTADRQQGSWRTARLETPRPGSVVVIADAKRVRITR